MSFFRRLLFELWYFRKPPWESGIVPPEVEQYINMQPSGRALDLGCGTGTSSIALAQAGWTVTGIDFSRRAIQLAHRKAKKAGVKVDFRVGDVFRLGRLRAEYDLVLDIGCYHGSTITQRVDYLHNLENLLAEGGTWLMYGFFKPDARPGPGLRPEDIEIARLHLKLARREDGADRQERPSAWFWFTR